MSKTIEVRVPDLGNFSEVGVIDVLVKAGDAVEVDTPLITLETEKATMDVPSSAAGVVRQVHVQKGGKVSEGSLVVTLLATEESDASRSRCGRCRQPRPPHRLPAAAAAPRNCRCAWCPTWATSPKWASSMCWSSRATRSKSTRRWSRSRPRRPRWMCLRPLRAPSQPCT